MSKKMMSIAILASLAMVLPFGADAKERFSSSHEPFSADMASRAEMEAYRKDLDTYVRDVDKQIEELLARRRDAVDRYNKAVRTYNEETFFHQDTLPYYPHYRRHGQQPGAYGHHGPCYAAPREKTPEERQRDRIDAFIDDMIDWGD